MSGTSKIVLRSGRSLRRVTATAATLAIAAGVSVAAAQPASAYVGDYVAISVGNAAAYLRTNASRSASPIALEAPRTSLTISCQRFADNVSGIQNRPGSSTLWDYVYASGRWGWMSDLMVDGTPYQVRDTRLPECAPAPRRWGNTRSYNAGVSGNCTWGVYSIVASLTGQYPALSGDAHSWYSSAIANGYTVVRDAQPRSIVVFQPGAQGAGGVGHVAWVESVEQRSDGLYIHILEMNFLQQGGWDRRTVRDVAGMGYILIP